MFRSSTLVLAVLLAVRASGAQTEADQQVINIKILKGQMRYDLTDFTVRPFAAVKLVFENTDDLPHNLVFFTLGTDVLAVSARNMENPREAVKRDWLPADSRVLAHTKMVPPKGTDVVVFNAPKKPGMYPFVCTFPGHALSMQGKMTVATPGPGLTGLTFALYLGDWKKLPDFSKEKPHREGGIADNLVQIKLDDYKNQFGVVYTGRLAAPKDGDYTFSLASDDGSRILVDGKRVVDHDGIHSSADVREGKVNLKAGEHEFRLEYFQATGEAEVFAGWRGADFSPTPLSKWVPPQWGSSTRKGKNEAGPMMPLIVGREPVIYRNFIAGAGNRGIGVGYPGGVNLAWTAEQMNLALVWRGGFIDAGRHWTDRGGGAQPPLGYDVFRPTGELSQPFAVLSSTDAEWPKTDKQCAEGYAWKGYTLDAKRYPTFFYEWSGVKVADRYDVQGDTAKGEARLIRTLKLTGAIPVNTYLRVATGATVTPEAGGFLVSNGRFGLEGREFENVFRIAAEGAQVAGRNLLIPARAEMNVTYAWPTDTAKR